MKARAGFDLLRQGKSSPDSGTQSLSPKEQSFGCPVEQNEWINWKSLHQEAEMPVSEFSISRVTGRAGGSGKTQEAQ